MTTDTVTPEFKTIDRPKVIRANAKPNPYEAPVQEFIDAGEQAASKAVAFELPMGKSRPVKVKGKDTDKTEYPDVLRQLNKLRSAAPDGYTVRTVVDYDKPRKGTCTVAFFVKAKPAPEAAPAAAPEGESPTP